MRPMHLLLGAAIAGAATFALLGRAPAPEGDYHVAVEPAPAVGEVALEGADLDPQGADLDPQGADELPPGHPPVGSGAPAAMMPTEAAGDGPGGEGPGVAWKTPPRWREVKSPSAMRLATYRVGEDAEMSVVRAGGSVDANVSRWLGQFDEGARAGAKRTERVVRGLKVTIVEARGRYDGGGGMMGASPAKDGWALLGVIVELPGEPVFFKLTGPATVVAAARPDVDALVASLEPAKG